MEPTSKPLPEVDRSLIHRPEQPCVLHGTLFFKDFQRVLGHAAMAASSLCRARRTGFWGVQPHWRISVPTCCRQCFTPNSRSKTAATRRRFHTSPRNPYASAPFAKRAGICCFCCLLSCAFRPGCFRAARAFSPFSRPRLSHWLTAPSVTPSASAISRCFQPFFFRSQARRRRISCV